MSELPAVPVPPTDLSAPHGASVTFLVICFIAMALALGYVLWARDGIGLLFLLGGLLAAMLEPMLDYLGLLWFAEDNVAIALQTFHRHVPLYVVLGYSFYFGGFSYVAYRAMQAGKGLRWFWGFFALDWLADWALQATGRALGLYEYYGPQPWMLFDVPAWWFTIDATLPVIAGGVMFLMRDHLHGLRALIIIAMIPACYAALNAAAGWPIFSALNSGPSDVVVWIAGAVTMVLALLYRQLTLEAVMRSRARELAAATRPAREEAEPAPVMREPVVAG